MLRLVGAAVAGPVLGVAGLVLGLLVGLLVGRVVGRLGVVAVASVVVDDGPIHVHDLLGSAVAALRLWCLRAHCVSSPRGELIVWRTGMPRKRATSVAAGGRVGFARGPLIHQHRAGADDYGERDDESDVNDSRHLLGGSLGARDRRVSVLGPFDPASLLGGVARGEFGVDLDGPAAVGELLRVVRE